MTIVAIILLALLVTGLLLETFGKDRMLFDIAILITLVFLLFGAA